MNEYGAIPVKIIDALNRESGYVLVVTGGPGVGKTLFSQEILRSMPHSFLILTSSENMPIYVDALKVDMQDWERRHVDVRFTRSLLDKSTDGTSFQEQLSSLIGTPIDIKDASTIIIDSWTDFMDPFPPDQQDKFEHTLAETARDEGIKLVLVTDYKDEDSTDSSLFHTADSIVRLEKVRDEHRTYRRLIVGKMRGMPIEQDEFVFTLYGGRFTYIPWYKHRYPAITIEREPLPDPSHDRISTGSKSLDTIIGGGFYKGALNLVEIDSLAAPYLETIYIPFLSNQLQLGRPAIILLPEGWSPERFTHGLTHFVDRGVVEEQVVFFGRQALNRTSNVRHIDEDPWKTLQEMRYEANQLVRRFKSDAIEFFALDTLENKFGADIAKGMIAEITASLPGTQTATILILSRHQKIKSNALPHSVHVAIQQICGIIGIFGVNPRTGILALTPKLSGGFLDYDLIPVI
ncbi:MAG: RAD55 family ATPase [Candidatus Thorarchaeota archaeon]